LGADISFFPTRIERAERGQIKLNAPFFQRLYDATWVLSKSFDV